MLPLVRRIKGYKGEKVQLARMKSSVPLEDYPSEELCGFFRDLTGENEKEILEMADVEMSEEILRLLWHFAILMANELGQPSSQELRQVS